MRILHCSDVHITENYFKLPFFKLGWRRWIAMAELQMGGRSKTYRQARASLERIAQESAAVDHVILSGDLTAYSLASEFEGARAALGTLAKDPKRFSVIPGNHDRYTPGSLRSRRFEKYFGHLLASDMPEYVSEDGFPFVRLVKDEVAIIGLCSARVPPVPGLSYGVIGERQFGSIEQILRDPRLAGRAVFVVVHHGPKKESGRPDKWSHGLKEADRLLRLLPGPRFALLHGHIHHRYHHPATAEGPHIFCAGSSTEKGHEGYWLLETREGQIASFEKRAF
jgi:3',5'-cyclic AMP phosphodiesterase CpdA